VQGFNSFGALPAGWSFRAGERSDFNGDGDDDVLVYTNTTLASTTREVGFWHIQNNGIAGWTSFGVVQRDWEPLLTGDFTGDGHDDVLWFHEETREGRLLGPR
jgi:FG-GAP-like repeat